MKLVIIESPYAGEIFLNTTYARRALRDSLERGEAPLASHLLYTQDGVLLEVLPSERRWGIDAGLAWRSVAELHVFYIDLGFSRGMVAAWELCEEENRPKELRSLLGPIGTECIEAGALGCINPDCMLNKEQHD